jgi:uncharacterized Zn-binding protein involved in type VI secretion
MNKKRFRIPIFIPGRYVTYMGKACMVENILISGYRVMVKLKEYPTAIDGDKVSCELTEFVYTPRE